MLTSPVAAWTLALATGSARGHEGHASHVPQATSVQGYTRSEARFTVPDVELVDASGLTTPLRRELDSGRPVMLNFIFTTGAAICPAMSATMSQVQDMCTPADRLRIVSISIDPEQDTPARLKEYAARHRAGPDWRLLTGSRQAILEVARAFGAWRGDKMNHSPATYLRGAGDGAWVRLDGFTTPSELMREYRTIAGTAPVSRVR